MTAVLPPLAIRPAPVRPAFAGPVAPNPFASHMLPTSTAPTAPHQRHRTDELLVAAHESARPGGTVLQHVEQKEESSQQGSSILSLLVEQLRDMRRENQYLHKSLRKLNSRQKKFKRRISDVEEENRRLLSLVAERHESTTLRTRISQGPFSQPIDPSLYSGGSSMLPPRLQAIKQLLPFLGDYDLRAAEVAIDDLSKPFAAFMMIEDRDAWPRFLYASPSYCRLFGYDQSELAGIDYEPLCHPMDHVSCEVAVLYTERPEHTRSPIGPVFHTTPIMLTKTGRTLRLLARSQYYFTHGGQAKWHLNTIDAILPGEYPGEDARLALSPPLVQTSPGSAYAALVSPPHPISCTTPNGSSSLGDWEADQTLASEGSLGTEHDLDELLNALHDP